MVSFLAYGAATLVNVPEKTKVVLPAWLVAGLAQFATPFWTVVIRAYSVNVGLPLTGGPFNTRVQLSKFDGGAVDALPSARVGRAREAFGAPAPRAPVAPAPA